jgi:hypothetical protein
VWEVPDRAPTKPLHAAFGKLSKRTFLNKNFPLTVTGFHVKVADEVAGGLTVKMTPTVCEAVPEAATVIVPLYVPAASPAVLTLAVSVPLPEPEAGVSDNQAALSPAVQFSGPPVLVRVTV